jgi:hypothetical protein
MENIIIESIITSLAIVGFYNATHYELDKNGNPTEKNLFWFVRYYVDKYIGEPYGKPFILCPRCMASLWGITFHFLVFRHSCNGFRDLLLVVVFVMMVSTLNVIFQKLTD